jgi:hypothetical protein
MMSSSSRTIAVWSNLPDGMDDFRWRQLSYSGADVGRQRGLSCSAQLRPCSRSPAPTPDDDGGGRRRSSACGMSTLSLVPRVVTDYLEYYCGARVWLQDRLSRVVIDCL